MSYVRRDSCDASFCCSSCLLACECCADKDEGSHVRQLLFVDENDPLVVSADSFAAGVVEEEQRLFENHDVEDEEAGEEEEEDEAEEEAPLVLTNVVLVPEV